MDRIDRLMSKLFGDLDGKREMAKISKVKNNKTDINQVKAWVNEYNNVVIQGYYYGKLVNVLIPFNDIDNYLFYVHGHAERLLKKHGHKLMKLKEGIKEVQIYP